MYSNLGSAEEFNQDGCLILIDLVSFICPQLIFKPSMVESSKLHANVSEIDPVLTFHRALRVRRSYDRRTAQCLF
jgi:hypothetical protein